MSNSRTCNINIFKSLYQQNQIQSLYQSADKLWREKRYEESIESCKKILSIKYEHSDAHNRLATNYKASNNIDRATRHYKLAIKYDRSHKKAYNNLGNIYCMDKKTWNKAQACYVKSIAIDPSYASAHANYAALLRKLGQVDNAKYHYKCAMKLSFIRL